ncbi:hypothetical protein [uncultured Adlercreutzia sp.]|uniref:hypothetical protein n=1 Tax=uncultured Adlercreutzia sp. TaxID=875803 RepID=UPI0025D367D5|nr:hypothetical protein [uncultured Adlercreutzia sp.]
MGAEEPLPLYVSIERAAKIAGVSEETMREWANRPVDHVPYLQVGKKKLVRVAGIAEFAQRMEAA